LADNSEQRFELKDILIVVPLFASSLAISWEVGRYQQFSGFDLFTIPEHLLAAVGYFPVAFSVAIFLVPTAMAARAKRDLTRAQKIIITVLLCVIIAASFGYVHFLEPARAVLLNVVLVPYAFIVINSLWLRWPMTSTTVLLALFGYSVIAAWWLAFDFSRNRMANANAGRGLSEIVTKAETLKAYIIGIGERGILFYSPDTSRVSFRRLDDIQKIEWQRDW
jgi:hypothetical protein